TIVNDHIPAAYMPEGFDLLLVRAEQVLVWPPFIDFVFRAIKSRIPLFLSLPGPVGTFAAKIFLNTELETKLRDRVEFLRTLNDLAQRLAKGPFPRVAFKHTKTP